MTRRAERRGNGEAVAATATQAISVVFVILLLGSYSLDRMGLGSSVPLAFPATLFAAAFIVPVWISRRGSVPPRSQPWRYLVGLWMLFGLLLASSAWGPPGIGTSAVISELIIMAALLTLAAFAVSLEPEAVGLRVVWLFALVGVGYALIGLTFGGGEPGRLSVLGGGPNVFGRMLAVGLVCLLWLILAGHLPMWAGLLAPLLLAALVLSGSRGAMAAGFAGVVYLALTARVGARRGLGTLAFIALLGVGLLAFTSAGSRVADVVQLRVLELTFEERYGSGREVLLAISWEIFRANPILGGGLGAFSEYIGFDTYPHNIVMSVLTAVGIVGGLLLILLLLPLVVLPFRSRRSPLVAPLLAIAMTLFVASSFSGGLYDSRFLWFALMVAATVAAPDLLGQHSPGGGYRSSKVHGEVGEWAQEVGQGFPGSRATTLAPGGTAAAPDRPPH